MSKYFELRPAVLPIFPSRIILLRSRIILAATAWIGRLFLRRYVKSVEIVGSEHLRGGGKFVLMNHSSPLDPLLLTLYGREFLSFLVTEPLMADRKASRFMAWLGQIPKKKFDTDTRAIRTMKEWLKIGGSVATFPEGQFSWDGRPLPLMPGLGELVRYLEVPVVIVRVINGDRMWPAWARHPRRTSLRFEISAPKTFQPGESVEDYVVEHLRVDPETCARWPVEGKKLAEGVARFLRYCFSCGADGALLDQGDLLSCSACHKKWTMTSDLQLHSKKGQSISVAMAWQQVRENLKKKWNLDGVSLRSRGLVTVMDASRPQWIVLEEAPLLLKGTTLSAGSWKIELSEILAFTMDWKDLILIRTARKRISIRFPEDSRAVWIDALESLK